MCCHTNFKQGQRILIKLRGGETFVTKYKARRSRYIETEAGDYDTRDLKFVGIYKGEPTHVTA